MSESSVDVNVGNPMSQLIGECDKVKQERELRSALRIGFHHKVSVSAAR
ncbi:hypothetical protein [Methylocaldum gracile]